MYPEFYKFSGDFPSHGIYVNGNNVTSNKTETYPSVIVKGSTYYIGKYNDVGFYTSFNQETFLSGYIEQCNYTISSESSQCKTYSNSKFNFTIEYSSGEGIAPVLFPIGLYPTNVANNQTATYIWVIAELCDMQHEIATRILVLVLN